MFKHNEKIPTSHPWLKLTAIVIPIIIAFVIAGLLAVNNWYHNNLEAVDNSGGDVKELTVVIESGSSVKAIAVQLHDLGLIRNETAFTWYVDREGIKTDLKAGTYVLSPAQSVQDITEILVDGVVATNLYTILPGLRIDELEEDFIEFGFDPDEVSDALNAKYDHPLFDDAPKNATLEGYIYPETYQITADSTPEDILENSFDEFYSQITNSMRSGLSKNKLNLHEAIILSSIVELETARESEQAQVAQVFVKRLNEGISLGSDPTFRYAAAITGEAEVPSIDSPYNTRIYAGLPPGPISNFHISALEAVADPADTDWLYFVSGDNGNTYFSKTLQEHQALTAKYCIELCKI